MTDTDELRKLLDWTKDILDGTDGEPRMIHTLDARVICRVLNGFAEALPSLLDELAAANAKVRVAEDWVYEKTRELEELRSAAREVIDPKPIYTLDLSEWDAIDEGRERALQRLAALVAPSVPETEETKP